MSIFIHTFLSTHQLDRTLHVRWLPWDNLIGGGSSRVVFFFLSLFQSSRFFSFRTVSVNLSSFLNDVLAFFFFFNRPVHRTIRKCTCITIKIDRNVCILHTRNKIHTHIQKKKKKTPPFFLPESQNENGVSCSVLYTLFVHKRAIYMLYFIHCIVTSFFFTCNANANAKHIKHSISRYCYLKTFLSLSHSAYFLIFSNFILAQYEWDESLTIWS